MRDHLKSLLGLPDGPEGLEPLGPGSQWHRRGWCAEFSDRRTEMGYQQYCQHFTAHQLLLALGTWAVLLLLFALCLRTLRTGLQCPDALGCNICVGIFAALFLQCVINIGMNLQVLPVIGVTLPFFSAGGSSVVMMYLCVGIVLSVGMNTRRSKLEMQRIV